MRDYSRQLRGPSARSKISTPWGVHTGDSIHGRPPRQDIDRQGIPSACVDGRRRPSSAKWASKTGGVPNIQFAIEPAHRPDDRDRNESTVVSRSSALASKATGFPIAKIAARLAVGHGARLKFRTDHHAEDAVRVSSRPLITW